jgi:hypothetical protein
VRLPVPPLSQQDDSAKLAGASDERAFKASAVRVRQICQHLTTNSRKPSTIQYTPKRDLTIERTHKIEFLEKGQAALGC